MRMLQEEVIELFLVLLFSCMHSFVGNLKYFIHMSHPVSCAGTGLSPYFMNEETREKFDSFKASLVALERQKTRSALLIPEVPNYVESV